MSSQKIVFDEKVMNRFFELAIKSKNPLLSLSSLNIHYCNLQHNNSIPDVTYDGLAELHSDNWTHGLAYLNT